MSRYNPDRDVDPIYEAAKKWRKVALLGEHSVFVDEKRLWTKDHIDELRSQFENSPYKGEETFLPKLNTQLSKTSPQCIQLMAEILWVMLLFPSSVRAPKTRDNVHTIWCWSDDQQLKTSHPLLRDDVLKGVGSAGLAYNTHRAYELDFFLNALCDFKNRDAADRDRIASDPWEFSDWLNGVKDAAPRQLTHILPHLLFPDSFERISSKEHKSLILDGFYVATISETNRWTETEISQELLKLRRKLEREHGKDIDFYQEEFESHWKVRWLLSWNPSKWPWSSFSDDRAKTMEGGKAKVSWECYAKKPRVGDRVFLVRTSIDPKGIVASGAVTKVPYKNQHWNPDNADTAKTTSFIDVEFDSVRDAEMDEIVSLRELNEREPDQTWSPQRSGIKIESKPAHTLERLWKKLSHPVARDAGRDNSQRVHVTSPHNTEPPLNLILYGPPGTGKTYSLKEYYMPNYQDSPGSPNPKKDRYKFVTFHQSYSYEDFVEGIRPRTIDGNITYEVRPGALREICDQARKRPDEKFAIFIDEINRGNIAKIFGELITLVEVDKRIHTDASGSRISNAGLEVTLPYSGDLFGVPTNVDVIGTMNTADRSIALLDSALRRRFRFEELTPNPELLESFDDVDGNTIDLQRLLETMNARICHLLHRDQTLGHSYLHNVKSFDELRTIFAREILPFLQEVFYDDWRQVRYVLADQAVKDELQLICVRNDTATDLFPKVEQGEIRFGDIFEVIQEEDIAPDAIRKIYDPKFYER